jgi:putative transposase
LKAMRADGRLTLANFSCCQDVLRRVDKTYKAFYARVKRGEKPGFPRYRSARRYDSITFPSYGDGCGLLATGKLRVQGAGHIKVKLHRPVEGEIKTVTIKREAARWFVIFSVEREASPLPPCAAEVGIDVGLSSFAVLSNGAEIPNPALSGCRGAVSLCTTEGGTAQEPAEQSQTESRPTAAARPRACGEPAPRLPT